MAITRVGEVSVGDLLEEDLRIPDYQRPYSWGPRTGLQLLDDIAAAVGSGNGSGGPPYVLGAVILLESPEGHYEVVDGQQRLLTLQMALRVLDGAADDLGPSAKAGPDRPDPPAAVVLRELKRRVRSWNQDRRRRIRDFMVQRCWLVRIVTDDVDEAFRVFDSQNYRGKPLAPHDLLKAHHLREMRGETDAVRAAAVEQWEATADEDLDRLFSVYLYRIVRWSRGERAPGFSTRDIEWFKGVSQRGERSPAARYHAAAQSAVPVLSAWSSVPPEDAEQHHRQDQRTRFQLDAPILAGRSFFEMVAFMLEDLQRLRRIGYRPEWERFASSRDTIPPEGDGPDAADTGDTRVFQEIPSRSRYRYVSELYLAALLYYVNRFGEDDLDAAKDALFAWAYTPRLERLRVQYRTIDNLGRGQDGKSAFPLLRNAPDGSAVLQLAASSESRGDEHEKSLARAIADLLEP